MYDYSHAPVHGKVTIGDITYPFSVYPEYFSEIDKDLQFTGNAHIVALTPHGTMSFLIYNDGELKDREHSMVFSNLPKEYQEVITDTLEKLHPHQ